MEKLRAPLSRLQLNWQWRRTQRRFLRILGILSLCWFALESLNVVQYDIWWQLVEGNFFWKTGHFPQTPPSSFAAPAQPYINEYVLYEAVLALWHKVVGWPGLWISFAAAALLPFAWGLAVWWRNLRRLSLRDAFGSWLLLMMGWWCYYWRIQQRPEFVGMLLVFGLTWWLLKQPAQPTAKPERTLGKALGLFLLFAAWTNIHGSFWIGLGILGLWAGQAMLQRLSPVENESRSLGRRLLSPLALMCAAGLGTLINPYGIARVLLPLHQQADPVAIVLAPEMRRLHWDLSICYVVFALVALAALVRIRGSLSQTTASSNRGWIAHKVRAWPFAWFGVSLITLCFAAICINRYTGFFGVLLALLSQLLIQARIHASHADALKETGTRLAGSSPKTAESYVATAGIGALAVLLLFFVGAATSNLSQRVEEEGGAYSTATHLFGRPALERLAALATEIQAPNGIAFWSTSQVAAFAVYVDSEHHAPGTPPLIRPFVDTGLPRFAPEPKLLLAAMQRNPAILEQVLNRGKAHYAVVTPWGWHWCEALNRLPRWKLVGLWPGAALYQRTDARPRLTEIPLHQIAGQAAHARGTQEFGESFWIGLHRMGPAQSLHEFLRLRPSWTNQDAVEFIFDWLARIPADAVKAALAQSTPGGVAKEGISRASIIALQLTLNDVKAAAKTAQEWAEHKRLPGPCLLRARAYEAAGDLKSAQRERAAAWPPPDPVLPAPTELLP